jgi:hypothetical protein
VGESTTRRALHRRTVAGRNTYVHLSHYFKLMAAVTLVPSEDVILSVFRGEHQKAVELPKCVARIEDATAVPAALSAQRGATPTAAPEPVMGGRRAVMIAPNTKVTSLTNSAIACSSRHRLDSP